MVRADSNPIRSPVGWIIFIASLIVGPFLCRLLFNAIGFWIPTTHIGFIDEFGRTILCAALVGIILFFLPLSFWQRLLLFLLYALIVGVATHIVGAMLTSV